MCFATTPTTNSTPATAVIILLTGIKRTSDGGTVVDVSSAAGRGSIVFGSAGSGSVVVVSAGRGSIVVGSVGRGSIVVGSAGRGLIVVGSPGRGSIVVDGAGSLGGLFRTSSPPATDFASIFN
ncbi:hypothetical protein HanXRQr2_Chr02g0066561 [Helianthus annuus]|uniref:Uncharacterized protein n=1 Tax=Helianthus annuus TaxID=4232 RepID=A0A9K3JMQ1_HELAN|nr:hypothetical protein HanXRQr2_Chr02g0066561 [Helianthus annuus]KAJ0618828.1 hypothetical protein HanHA89_Chr02g0058001 [Helianthus annuus]KAJ0777284.1 hypothetical protein HanLR1_Chr02g0055611 [Helianthus annuus]KAJ0951870.1 hypothetical protein HanPSC8_Chr02g0065451 [Helianthus annuus]